MTTRGTESWHQKAALSVALLGGLFCFVIADNGDRWAAFAGVVLALFTCLFALVMKGFAIRKNMDATLLTIGVTFFLRLLVVAGLVIVAAQYGHGMAATIGFFGAYFPMQIIEISYVLRSARALSAAVRS